MTTIQGSHRSQESGWSDVFHFKRSKPTTATMALYSDSFMLIGSPFAQRCFQATKLVGVQQMAKKPGMTSWA